MSILNHDLNVTFPNAFNGKDATEQERQALIIEEFTGMVEGTIQRRSVVEKFIPVRQVRGTSTFTNYGVGASTLQKVVPGKSLDGIKSDFAKNSVTVDTVIAAREAFPLLDVFQTQIDVRREVSHEQGKSIAKFYDQAIMIQALKAARMNNSSFAGNPAVAGKPKGHGKGNQVSITAADFADPNKLYAALKKVYVSMELQDVDPRNDDVITVVSPVIYDQLLGSEMLIRTDYVTSVGNKVQDAWVLKAVGVPIYASNNLPQESITGHMLTTAYNDFDGDFSSTLACVFSPRAVMAGSTIPLETDVYYDKLSKSWLVDSHLAFSVGPNRVEYAGELTLATAP